MRVKNTLSLIAALFLTFSVIASESHGESSGEKDIKTEIKETISHHLLDSYDFTIMHGVSFPLPVILFDNGLQVFMSSKFNHGESVAESNGNYYKIHHGKIYKVDGPEGEVVMGEDHHATNTKPLDFSITKNVFMIILVSLLMLVMFKRAAKGYETSKMPQKMARFLEPIILFIRDDIAIPNIGKKYYKRYMSFLLTIFFFIWIMNLAGLTPFGINVTGNIAVTAALAILTFIITTFSGKKDYWMHIFWMPGVPYPMRLVLAPIELLGIFIKPFSLMIRLYANMLAGHVVLMSIIGLIFIFKSWVGGPLSFGLAFVLGILELLVAALQAYIFTMLAALYFGSAVEEHAHH